VSPNVSMIKENNLYFADLVKLNESILIWLNYIEYNIDNPVEKNLSLAELCLIWINKDPMKAFLEERKVSKIIMFHA
jgi:hypothetical protein